MSKFVFISAFAGKAKSTQKPFNRVTIAGVKEDGETRVYDLFTRDGVRLPNQDSLRFGDVVEPKYMESEFPGGRQSLCGLTVTSPSPFFVN